MRECLQAPKPLKTPRKDERNASPTDVVCSEIPAFVLINFFAIAWLVLFSLLKFPRTEGALEAKI